MLGKKYLFYNENIVSQRQIRIGNSRPDVQDLSQIEGFRFADILVKNVSVPVTTIIEDYKLAEDYYKKNRNAEFMGEIEGDIIIVGVNANPCEPFVLVDDPTIPQDDLKKIVFEYIRLADAVPTPSEP